ncbi:MAG: methyltransferase domain-containing protein [bacterium]|nr:methyltransferase domain-containing protein [bacterium]
MDTQKLEKILGNVGDMALKRRARLILTSLDIKDTDSVLDAGGGDGYYSKLVLELTKAKVSLYDFDENALNSARRNLKDKNIEISQGSVHQMAFPANSFDKIILTEVMEHVPYESKGFDELYRVLRPGGLLAITVPNANFPFFWDPLNWIMQNVFHHPIKHSPFEDFFAGIWYGHLRLYKVDDLRKKLEEHKFVVKDMQAVTHFSLPFQHYILNIMARLLYGGKMSESMKESVSKFETEKTPKRPLPIRFGFWLFSTVDKPNDNIPLSASSVSLYALCSKK